MSRQALRSAFVNLIQEARDARFINDRELLEPSLNEDDKAALAGLVRRHGRSVRQELKRWLKKPEDVEDAFQATFLVLVEKANEIRWQDNIGPWLRQVAINVARRLQRNNLRRAAGQVPAELPDHRTPPPDVAASRREAGILLHEQLDRLAESDRRTLLLRHRDELTQDQVAEEMGVHRGTVSKREKEARKQIKPRLAEKGVTPAVVLAAIRGDCPPRVAELAQAVMVESSYFTFAKGLAAVVLLSGMVVGMIGWAVVPRAAPAVEVAEARALPPEAAQQHREDALPEQAPPPVLRDQADADREVALYVVSHSSAQVITHCGVVIRKPGQVPAKEFRVRDIYLPTTMTVDAEAIALLNRLGKLHWLHLAAKQGTGVRVEEIRAPSLRTLKLCEWKLSDKSIAAVTEMGRLTTLHITHTGLTDAQFARLATKLPLVRELNLKATKITDDGLLHLRHFKKLDTLDLSQTSVTPAGLDRLKPLGLKKLIAEKLRGADDLGP